MRLLIDIGNSRLKWRLQKHQGEVLARGVESLADLIVEDCFKQWLALGLKGDEGVIFYASVAHDSINTSLQESALQHAVSCQRFFSQPQWRDLINSYQQPLHLGVDRWLAMVAVRNRYQGSACVIDCGSATTVDYITATGLHEGGLIMPGEQLMQQSLLQKTANIALSSVGGSPNMMGDEPLLGKDTYSAVRHGVGIMHEANVMRLVTSAQQQNRQVFLTGGGSQKVAKTNGVNYLPELVLDGIALLANDFFHGAQ